MLSHSMEISASLTKLFCWLRKSVQPLQSRHPKRFHNAMFLKRQGKHRQTNKGNICSTKILGTQLFEYPDVPMSGSQGTCPNGQPLGSPDSGPVSGSMCLSSSTACLVNRLDKTTLLTWETVQIFKFNIWYLRCHAGDEMWNCIAKTCRTKLLGTPLLKTHRRVSAKCVTYSGTGSAKLCCIGTSCAGMYSPLKNISNWQVLEQVSTPYIEKHLCGTKILGTQLFRTTQMCQGSTCHVVAQHGDISKLNKALLLTWEVCATIAIKTSKEISQCHVPKKTRQTKANRPRQHLWHKDSWDTTV